jgi:hypothetical protein
MYFVIDHLRHIGSILVISIHDTFNLVTKHGVAGTIFRVLMALGETGKGIELFRLWSSGEHGRNVKLETCLQSDKLI